WLLLPGSIRTSRPGAVEVGDTRKTVRKTLYSVVLTPTPRPSESVATIVSPGSFRSARNARSIAVTIGTLWRRQRADFLNVVALDSQHAAPAHFATCHGPSFSATLAAFRTTLPNAAGRIRPQFPPARLRRFSESALPWPTSSKRP